MSDKSYTIVDGKVHLSKADGKYWSYYEMGEALEERFPGQSSGDFCGAISNGAGTGPLEDPSIGISYMECRVEGENDSGSWEWVLRLTDGSHWVLEAWCDYTGWGCQDGGTWTCTKPVTAKPAPGYNTPDAEVEELRASNVEVRAAQRKLEDAYRELSILCDKQQISLLRYQADAMERAMEGRS